MLGHWAAGEPGLAGLLETRVSLLGSSPYGIRMQKFHQDSAVGPAPPLKEPLCRWHLRVIRGFKRTLVLTTPVGQVHSLPTLPTVGPAEPWWFWWVLVSPAEPW